MDEKMLENCFVDRLLGSVTFIDTLPPTSQGRAQTRPYHFSRLQDLNDFFDKPESRNYSCRFL